MLEDVEPTYLGSTAVHESRAKPPNALGPRFITRPIRPDGGVGSLPSEGSARSTIST